MDRIANKLDDRRDRLQSIMLECQDIHLSLADFLNDLAGIEEEFAGMRPVSAVHDTLKEQEREFKVFLTIFLNFLYVFIDLKK
jgi:hypothetical protein